MEQKEELRRRRRRRRRWGFNFRSRDALIHSFKLLGANRFQLAQTSSQPPPLPPSPKKTLNVRGDTEYVTLKEKFKEKNYQ